jgi:spermidine synthase
VKISQISNTKSKSTSKKPLSRGSFIDSLTPKVVFTSSSKFNKDIKVIKIGKTKKLIVNGLVQSFSNSSRFAKKRVWGEVVATINRQAPKTEEILLLGMGAGTMVHMLNKKFAGTKLQITSVEIDQIIVDVSNKYFDLESVDNNRVIVADAYDVIKNPAKYDITSNPDCVIVDTYCGDVYPNNISDKSFLKNLFKMVGSGTFVIFNHVILRTEIYKLEEYKKELEEFMSPLNVTKINCRGVSDNYLFYGIKRV